MLNPLKLLGMLAAIAISVPVIVYTFAQTTTPTDCPAVTPPTCSGGMHVNYPPSTPGSCPGTPSCVADEVTPSPTQPTCPTMTMPNCAIGTHMYSSPPPVGSACPSQPTCVADQTTPSSGTTASTSTSTCVSYPDVQCTSGMHKVYPTPAPGSSCPTPAHCEPDAQTFGGGPGGATSCPPMGPAPICGSGMHSYYPSLTPGSSCPATPTCVADGTQGGGYGSGTESGTGTGACPSQGPPPTCATGTYLYYPWAPAGTGCPAAPYCRSSNDAGSGSGTSFGSPSCPTVNITCAADEYQYYPPTNGSGCPGTPTCRKRDTMNTTTCPSTPTPICANGQTLYYPPTPPGPGGCPPTPYCRPTGDANTGWPPSSGERCNTTADCAARAGWCNFFNGVGYCMYPSGPAMNNPCPAYPMPNCKAGEIVYSPPQGGASCPSAPTCRPVENSDPSKCLSLPTTPPSCPPGNSLYFPPMERRTPNGPLCPTQPYCRPPVDQIPLPVDKDICPKVPSVTSCPAGQTLETTTGRCPTSYCKPSGDVQPPLPDQSTQLGPGELQAALQQIKSQQRELARFAAIAKRQAPALQPDIDQLKKSLDGFASTLSAKGATRSDMNAYTDAHVQDATNDLRHRLDLSQRLAPIKRQMAQEIKRRRTMLQTLAKTLNAKKPDDVVALLRGLGLNTDALTQLLADSDHALSDWDQRVQTAATALTDDAVDDAQQALSEMRDQGAAADPQQMTALNGLIRELVAGYGKPLAAVKDADVRDALKDLLGGALDLVGSGDYAQAQQTLRTLPPEVRGLFLGARSVNAANRDRFLQRIEDLKARI